MENKPRFLIQVVGTERCVSYFSPGFGAHNAERSKAMHWDDGEVAVAQCRILNEDEKDIDIQYEVVAIYRIIARKIP